MKSVLQTFLAVLPVCLLSAVMAEDLPVPDGIVLCMADDQGWGDVGYYGHEVLQTPVLDKMAATGLRFDRFYAAAPVCSPTRGSVLTGRHPSRYGCFSWGHMIRPQEVTVAEVLRDSGWTTGHFGKWHLGPVTKDHSASPGNSGFDKWVSAPNFFDNNPILSNMGTAVQTQGESSQVTVNAAIEFIRHSVKNDQKFLAVVWFGSPHGPHQALPQDREPYKHLKPALQNFYGEITAMDRAIGVLRDELRTLGISDNTLFWYTSDNGALPVGSTAGLSGKKGNLREGGLRVPAIIEWPAVVTSHRICNINCNTVDTLPTVAEIAATGWQAPHPLDGESIAAIVRNESFQRTQPMGFWVHPTRGISTPSAAIMTDMLAQQQDDSAGHTKPADPRSAHNPADTSTQYPTDSFPGSAAWIDKDDKLLVETNRNGKTTLSLFHLGDDPAEKNDLAQESAEKVQQMHKQLLDWQSSVVNSLNGNDYN
jgi:arylsulfatase A-like enzyme